MALTLALDASPLGRLVNARHYINIQRWVGEALDLGATIYLPEIADYELRRGLLSLRAGGALRRLDALARTLVYLPLDTTTMRQAATLWAQAKQSGHLNAHPSELNGDVILAAQALQVGAIVVTENLGHLSLFARAVDWRTSEASELLG